MAYTQEDRFIAIDTPLGKDVLLLASIKGTEGLSRLFSFELGMVSENHAVVFEDIIGKNVTISVDLADQSKRYFNGIIARFSQGRGGGAAGGDPRVSHYRATMVPWPWLLTTTADSRIYQKLSVPEIVEKIFKEKGFSDFRLSLHGTYAKRDYCVQYRETDFHFISRLLEDEGIHYFFEHAQGKHVLVLADDPGDHKPCPKQASARYQLTAGGSEAEDVITAWEAMQEIRPAKYSLNDFNFEMPNTSLLVNVPTNKVLGPGEREIYDYPGMYAKKAEGDRIAKIRMEEEEAQITTTAGSSNCRAFTSGYRFTLTDFYRSDMDSKEYVLTALEHEANQDFEKEAPLVYANRFTCIPADVPFRPVRTTEKPVVRGTQTAIVVGPAGDEIYTDEHGRVKVQFHWDREGKKDDKSSCWIRVSHAWAGGGWGAMYIPRIGHEVIVDFLEGDPDRPIVTGRVYHGTNKPPYQLPNEKTKSTLMSNTSPGGTTHNELLMEDKQGKTQVVLSNAYGHKITEDEDTQTLTVETRDKNLMRMDDKNQSITVQTTKAHTVLLDDKNQKMVLQTTDGHAIEMDDKNQKMLAHTKNGHTLVMDDKNKKVELTTMDGHSAVFDDGNQKIGITSKKGHYVTIDDAKDSITLEDSSGTHRFKVESGGSKLVISSDSGNIELEAPSGKISLKATQIEIEAQMDVKMKGGMNVTSEAGVQYTIKGTMVTTQSSGPNTIKGTPVMIN